MNPVEELITIAPNTTGPRAAAIMWGIMDKPWRCYSGRYNPAAEELAQRFIRAHAHVPGIITDTMPSTKPVTVFYYHHEETGSKCKGGLWLNGAVLYATDPEIGGTLSLFIDEQTAKQWAYPDEGWVNLIDLVEGPADGSTERLD